MKYLPLGTSDLKVSDVCLGTMTWGIQNSQQDANEQLSMALAAGVNFVDTAEMYPVPPNQETYADTERLLGNWLGNHAGRRQELIVMTKIVGNGVSWIRDGQNISGQTISQAIDDSLARLQTDYIDVYQLHWPNRTTPHFGKHWPGMTHPQDIDREQELAGMRDILQGLDTAMQAGKIRHWGLSDDTPWGIHTFLRLCDEMGIARPVSIQNEFSLLHIKDCPYLIEMCALENIAYLPWSPLATGMLTGKYLNEARPQGSRWTYAQRQGLFRNQPMAQQATQAYVDLAREFSMTPAQLALAWCRQVPGVTSTIIGATSLTQLEENLEAFESSLSEDALVAVDKVLRQYPAGF